MPFVDPGRPVPSCRLRGVYRRRLGSAMTRQEGLLTTGCLLTTRCLFTTVLSEATLAAVASGRESASPAGLVLWRNREGEVARLGTRAPSPPRRVAGSGWPRG